ncbi:MAG: DUF1320 domain-containing protein [Alphaproteobacteria bacterium]|jgi:phage gp36-like protein|nr:DUF1320 domain-containing protein [Alphaproteobacteria bacterium]
MRYCDRADIGQSIPLTTLVNLSSDDPLAVDPDEAVITRAVDQADELIDAHLRGRYTLPLAPVPGVLRDIAVNLARHWLYSRRPEGNGFPEAVTRTYKAGLETLVAIRDGKVTLGVSPGGPAAPEPGEVKMRAPTRRFDRDVLDRY